MDVTNIIQTRTYELNDEEKVPIIKNLARKRGTLANTNIHRFEKRGMQNSRGTACNAW